MATLSKKFKKSNKSKSSSRSRKHFNKSRKNGLKTKKMMRGGATMPKKQGRMSRFKGWLGMKPKPIMTQPIITPTVMEQKTMAHQEMPKKNWVSSWNTPEYKNALAKHGPEPTLAQLSAERLAQYGPEPTLKQLHAKKLAANTKRAAQKRDALLGDLAEGANNPNYR